MPLVKGFDFSRTVMLVMNGTLSKEFLARLVSFTCCIGSLKKYLYILRLEGLSKSKRKSRLVVIVIFPWSF